MTQKEAHWISILIQKGRKCVIFEQYHEPTLSVPIRASWHYKLWANMINNARPLKLFLKYSCYQCNQKTVPVPLKSWEHGMVNEGKRKNSYNKAPSPILDNHNSPTYTVQLVHIQEDHSTQLRIVKGTSKGTLFFITTSSCWLQELETTIFTPESWMFPHSWDVEMFGIWMLPLLSSRDLA